MGHAYSFLIAGGGIAGLSASIALSMQGHTIKLIERQSNFSEVGAGLQIGPNAWRCLRAWGLEDDLREYCSLPNALMARDLHDGQTLGQVLLGARSVERYGAPYATFLRADLHKILLDRAKQSAFLSCANGYEAIDANSQDNTITVDVNGPHGWKGQVDADALIAADGVFSTLKTRILSKEPATPSGMTAFRGTIKQSALPERLRSNAVCAWLGKHMHVVIYPVLRNEWLNVVLIVSEKLLQRPTQRGPADMQATLESLTRKKPIHHELHDLFLALQAHGQPTHGARWTEWPLSICKPIRSAEDITSGRTVFVGDAAHPMVPFLAQGAAMAIEDAEQLQQSIAQNPDDLTAAIAHFAQIRALRCAKVQRQSLRNGKIFHMSGASAWARDTALHLAPTWAMDKPWLYAQGPVPVTR
ncbi:FAD-dependent monooxygenase [Lampropedia puyangensis]|nr:FAD-dependent monooxygenase [Lampropedia puyangensis]